MKNHEPVGTEQIRVVIVDDHPIIRDGLRTALAVDPQITIEAVAEDGLQGIKMIRQLQPEIALLDINLPKMNGLEVLRELQNMDVATRIIVLTAHHDVEQIVHVIKAGAAAYLAKDIDSQQLVRVVHLVAQGNHIIDDQVLDETAFENWLDENVQNLAGPYTLDQADHYAPLSPREMEILRFVTQGMSNKQIAIRLSISQQTVKNHMTSILRKLNVEDRTQAAVLALRKGWVRI